MYKNFVYPPNKLLHLNKNVLSVFVQDRNPVRFLGFSNLLAAKFLSGEFTRYPDKRRPGNRDDEQVLAFR